MPTATKEARSKRIQQTRQVVREDLRDFVQTRRSPSRPDLDERQREALKSLRHDGFAVIEGYWPRERALEMKERLEAFLEVGTDTDYDEGAYLRFQDDAEYDQGVRRLFHVEKVVPELEEFRYDPFVLEIAEAYYRRPYHSVLLIYQYNTKSNDNTRYYHVDSFRKEFKSFMYLDDVDVGNGPYTYLRGSHRSHVTRLRKQLSGNEQGAATSFYPDDIKRDLKREVQVCGPAGTLILTDVRGFHRGSPQLDRSRSALVNYIVRHKGDRFPAK
jgi:hypothetical protein